ncbi:hypothetical protein [Isoptericola sp. NPDC057191]|uniref:hypothetical protein n=1 Tax=Isoptericola sp. NPDC057191 TaxID=3346041 RepID=UPI0036259728
MTLDDMNRVEVTVRPASWAGDDSNNDALVFDLADLQGLDEDTLRRELIEMTGVTDGYHIDERRGTTEWGASGATYELLLTVAESAWQEILSIGIYAFLSKMRKQFGRPSYKEPRRSEEELVEHARYRVAMRYEGVEVDSLTVLETEIGSTSNGQTFSVRLVDNADVEYRVSMSEFEHTTFGRIERRSL